MTEHSKKTHEKLDFDQEEFNNVKQRMGKMLAAHARQNDLLDESQETVENLEVDGNNVLKELIEKYLMKEDPKPVKKKVYDEDEDQQADMVDFSKVQRSDEYFDLVSHQIPISDLYSIVDTSSNSQENTFAAVIIHIEDAELQRYHSGRYMLQVWTFTGTLVYSLTLQQPIHVWNLNGRYLTFIKHELEPKRAQFRHFQCIYAVVLSENVKIPCKEGLLVSQQFNFYETEYTIPSQVDRHVSWVDGHLVTASDYEIKYVKVSPSTFYKVDKYTDHQLPSIHENALKYQTLADPKIVAFKAGVRVLKIVESQQGRSCIVTEQISGDIIGHVSFLALHISSYDGNLVVQELTERKVRMQEDQKPAPDRVVRLISTIFKEDQSGEFKHCGVALRQSGSLDYFWNYRQVDSFLVNDLTEGGFVTDIYHDFGYLYYKKVFIDGPPELLTELKNPGSKQYNRFIQVFSDEPEQVLGHLDPEKQKKAREVLEETKQRKRQRYMQLIKVKQVLYKCYAQWKERIGTGTSVVMAEGPTDIKRNVNQVKHQHVANFAKLYPWFSNMQTHFAIAHLYFLSVYNISICQWQHYNFEKEWTIVSGFRIIDKETELYWAGLVLKNNRYEHDDRLSFIRISDGQMGAQPAGTVCPKCVIAAEQRKIRQDRAQENNNLKLQLMMLEKQKESEHIPVVEPDPEVIQKDCPHDINIKLPNGETAYRPMEQRFGGEVIKIAIDKQQQRFVIFLVKKHQQNILEKESTPKQKKKKVIEKQTSTESDETFWQNHWQKTQIEEKDRLCLRIYVNKCQENNELRRLKIDKNLLNEDSDIFVIPSPKETDETFIILDNCQVIKNPNSYFFRLYDFETFPTLHLKNMENYKRPINIDMPARENRMVGYIDHRCQDNTDARVFVTRNDLVVTKVHGGEADEDRDDTDINTLDGRIYYKYFTQRHIQAILQLDSWMYTLSNPCEVIKNQGVGSSKATECSTNDMKASAKIRHLSSFFDQKGNPVEETKLLNGDETQEPSSADFSARRVVNAQEKAKKIFSGNCRENPGLYAYDLQRLANSGDLITYNLKDAIVGVNRHIDFCNNSYRISYLKSFDSIEMVPIPHRNTINFLGMKSKSNYFIWREGNGIFSALDKECNVWAWEICTGKQMKSIITAETMVLDGFELYQCNLEDDTYKRNWQQHPHKTIALLKSKKRMDTYEVESSSLLAENQPANIRDYKRYQIRPKAYMFKCLSMDDQFCKEEFSFIFDYRCQKIEDQKEGDAKNNKQWLILSRNLNKLLELYSDSRCSIYQKRYDPNKNLVEWDLIQSIKKYPVPLQGSSYSNFLFSPNFNFFIDTSINDKEFVIKSSQTNFIVCRIPNDLYAFKIGSKDNKSLRILGSRMWFICENMVRIINKHGLDTIIELNVDENGNCIDQDNPVIIKSVCKIDHFDPHVIDEKHAILDKKVLKPEDTLTRLIRTTQRFKCKQYHLRDSLDQRENQRLLDKKHDIVNDNDPNILDDGFEDELDKVFNEEAKKINAEIKFKAREKMNRMASGEIEEEDEMFILKEEEETMINEETINQERVYSRLLHESLQKVDYTQNVDLLQSQFVAENTFTILDWQIIERIIQSKTFHIGLVDPQRIIQLCFNIFPQIKTVLHFFVQASLDIKQMKSLFNTTNSGTIDGKIKVAMPILQDINGDTALDLCLTEDKQDRNLANQILEGIARYPFMHSGFALVKGINRAFKWKVPFLSKFLELRRISSGHLSTNKNQTGAIYDLQLTEAGNCQYGTMVAEVWQRKKIMRDQLFDKSKLARKLRIQYFDIPELHDFNEQGHQFFETLSNYEHIDIFENEVIQIIITQKWMMINRFISVGMYIPYQGLLITNLIWHVQYRPFRSNYVWENRCLASLTFIEVLYFLYIEAQQCWSEPQVYFNDVQNLQNIIPLYTCAQSVVISLIYDEEKDGDCMHPFLAGCTVMGLFLLWQNLFYYLRISVQSGYLVKAIEEVQSEMKTFFIIYMIFHFAFAEGFHFISLASKEPKYQFAQSYTTAIQYSFYTALGEYYYSPFFEDRRNPNKWTGMLLMTACCMLCSVVMLNLLISIICDKFADVTDLSTLYMYQNQASMIAQYQRIIPKNLLKTEEKIESEMLSCRKLLLIIEQEHDASHKTTTESTQENQEVDKPKVQTNLEKCDSNIDELLKNFTVLKEDLILCKQKQMAKRNKRRKSRVHLSIDKQNTFVMQSKDCSPLFGRQATQNLNSYPKSITPSSVSSFDEDDSELYDSSAHE